MNLRLDVDPGERAPSLHITLRGIHVYADSLEATIRSDDSDGAEPTTLQYRSK